VSALVCLIAVASALALGACGSGGGAQGASPEQLKTWAQSLDVAGADLGQTAAAYEKVVASIEKAVDKNATALTTWDKEWKKRQAAYETQVAEVNASNQAERAKAKPATMKLISEGGSMTLPDGRVMAWPPQYKMVPGYTPHLQALPAKPAMPAMVKVKISAQNAQLKKLEKKLVALHGQVGALQTGEGFTPVLADLQGAVAQLQTRVHDARLALKNAVKTDKKRGDVLVAGRIAKVSADDLAASLAALRAALLAAAEKAGVASGLTWAPASGSGAVTPGPAASSPAP
jgi:hypothetical protein